VLHGIPALSTFELTKDYAVGFWRKRLARSTADLDVEAASVRL
jgi:hypothetical protein